MLISHSTAFSTKTQSLSDDSKDKVNMNANTENIEEEAETLRYVIYRVSAEKNICMYCF